MDFEHILREFSAGSDVPRDALRAALDQWETAGPRLATLFAEYVSGADRSEQTERALFYVIHLLADRRQISAFAPLCRLLLDAEAAELVLDEVLDSSLNRLLVNLFDGDPRPLQEVVETEAGDEAARFQGMLALAYLTHEGRVPEADMRAWLTRLLTDGRPRAESELWLGWVCAVVDLGWKDLADTAEELCRSGFVNEELMRAADVRRSIRLTLDDPRRLAGFDHDGVGPYDIVSDLINPPPPAAGERQDDGWQPPVRNPLRHVGRNDPCPCGSGRKYKKCCLA